MVTEEWEWFCGRNTSYLNTPLDEWVNNTCFINGVSLLPHAGFIALSSLLLFVFGCCSSYRKIKTKYILTFPGHSLRWIVSILTLLLLGASIGEGVLTDETYKAWQQPTQPHLYMHGAGAFLACVFSLIYYHHVELWQAPFMSFLLLGYWATAAGGEALRMSNLVYQNQIDFNVLRFDLTVALLVCFGLLFLIEVYVILARVSSILVFLSRVRACVNQMYVMQTK